jgi:hypothetical protein
MTTDARRQRDLIAVLRLESLFDSAQLGFPTPAEAALIKPTEAETARAQANIGAWRAYLPETCVSSMINDGWQWST